MLLTPITKDYLVGLHISGDPNSYEKFSDDSVPNAFIQSSHFCEDYESVCGQPCAELEKVKVLQQKIKEISL